MKRLKFLPILIISLFTISCCKNTGKKEMKQELTVNIEHEPTTLDPRKAILFSDYNIIKAMNDGLFRTDKNGKTVPSLVESYTISDDKKTYTFNLKKSFWSNGDRLTAHDFIYSWKCSLAQDFPSPVANLLYPIKNAEKIKTGELPISMIGARAKDDYTLVVELEYPAPYFTELCKNVIYYPINETYDKTHAAYTDVTEMISCGPFKITTWKSNNEMTFEKNPYYWEKEAVKLDKLTLVMIDPDTAFKMYQNGDLDWIGAPSSSLPLDCIETMKRDDRLQKTPLMATYMIRINTENELLKNEDLRKSLALSINRDSICRHILHGEGDPTTGLVPKLMGLQDKPYFEDGNENLAKEYLAKSGLRKKKLRLSFPSSDNYAVIAQAIQDQWKQTLDIDVELEPLDFKVYLDKVAKKDFQLSCGRWIADYKDPVAFLDVYKSKKNSANWTGWEDNAYIKAFTESFNHINEERMALLKETESTLMQDMPLIPIYNAVMLHLKNERVQDVVITEMSDLDFKFAYVSK